MLNKSWDRPLAKETIEALISAVPWRDRYLVSYRAGKEVMYEEIHELNIYETSCGIFAQFAFKDKENDWYRELHSRYIQGWAYKGDGFIGDVLVLRGRLRPDEECEAATDGVLILSLNDYPVPLSPLDQVVREMEL